MIRAPHRPSPEDIENARRKLIHCRSCDDWFYYVDENVRAAEVTRAEYGTERKDATWERWVDCPCGARRVLGISSEPFRSVAHLAPPPPPDAVQVGGHRYVLAEPTPLAKPSEEFFTKEQRAEMLVKMHEASETFYWAAFRARCHSFIELTGFMNEFIKLCEEAQKEDVDWTQSNVHNKHASLPMREWHARYLGEKFGCIFAGTLARKPELLEIFVAALKEG